MSRDTSRTRPFLNRFPLALAFALTLGACAVQGPGMGEPPLRLDGARASETMLLERMARADIVVLGEIHDNAEHHRLQAALVQALVSRGLRPAVVWEMVPRGLDPVLRDYAGTAADLGAALEWETRGWPDWSLYQPIAEVALANGLPMRAGDLDPATLRALARTGPMALGPERARRLGLADTLPDAVQAAMLREQEEAHCGLMPANRLGPMVMVQRGRDAALAEAALLALEAPGADLAVLITGAGHARTDRAVPAVLARIAPSARVLSLAFVEAPPGIDPGAPDALPADLPPFDAVWLTKGDQPRDYCAELRDAMSRPSGG